MASVDMASGIYACPPNERIGFLTEQLCRFYNGVKFFVRVTDRSFLGIFLHLITQFDVELKHLRPLRFLPVGNRSSRDGEVA
jgi:hypothetical protein